MKHIWHLPFIEFLPFSEIKETNPVVVITSGPAWEAVKSSLRLPINWQVEVRQATLEHWDLLGRGLQDEIIYAIGGGLAVDAAKYLSSKYHLPLVCLPTALSVDAFLTWTSGIRQAGCVRYIETRPPDRMVVDLEVIASAPPAIRAAGICNVLSIATGCWDWRFAGEKGKNPPGMPYVPYVAQAAEAILQGALDCAEAAGRGDPDGLKQLLDCLALGVQLCNQIGHTRPKEGSEHYFAYAAESQLQPEQALPNCDLLAPGILQIAECQGQDITPLKHAIQACNIPLDRIPPPVVAATLLALPDYVQKHDLPFGIAHTLGS